MTSLSNLARSQSSMACQQITLMKQSCLYHVEAARSISGWLSLICQVEAILDGLWNWETTENEQEVLEIFEDVCRLVSHLIDESSKNWQVMPYSIIYKFATEKRKD